MRKKLNRTSVIILLVAALTVVVPSLIVYSNYDRARKGEQLVNAIWSGNTGEALSLIKSGADTYYAASQIYPRSTTLELACDSRNVEVVKYLLSHGVKAQEVGQDKASLIRRTLESPDIFSSRRCNEIMQILIDHGADVNGENKNDPRPIILAIQNQQIESVKFLIEHEANVNMTRGDNNSPIWEATVTGNNFALQLLLKAGADPVKCGTSFEQLIDVAQKDYRDETAAILKDAMAKRKAAGSGGLKK